MKMLRNKLLTPTQSKGEFILLNTNLEKMKMLPNDVSTCSKFDWLAFVRRVVESKDEPARSVSSSEHIVVRAPAYFKELFKLIEGTDARYATLMRGHTQCTR